MGTEIPDGVSPAQGSNNPARELCSGKYQAQQIPGAVVIFADGWHPSTGYRTYFEKSLIAIYPPEFALIHELPQGPTLQVMTPFRIWTMFSATDPVAKVIVHDANGKHEVKVEQVPDFAAAGARKETKWVIAPQF